MFFKFTKMKVVCLVVLAFATIEMASGFPASLRFHLNSFNDNGGDEKRFSIDNGKNLLMESSGASSKDYPASESLAGMQDRLKRRLSDYSLKSRSLTPDDIYFQQFLPRASYGNENPDSSFYDGFKTQEDNAATDDGGFDDGLWMNTISQPHYEYPGMRRSGNIAKRFKARQLAENNYFTY